MTTDSGDTMPENGAGAEDQPASERVETTGSAQSPYDIGLLADEEETGPKPLDTELQQEQAKGEA